MIFYRLAPWGSCDIKWVKLELTARMECATTHKMSYQPVCAPQPQRPPWACKGQYQAPCQRVSLACHTIVCYVLKILVSNILYWNQYYHVFYQALQQLCESNKLLNFISSWNQQPYTGHHIYHPEKIAHNIWTLANILTANVSFLL